MKIISTLTGILLIFNTYAQVTLISNDTDLETGFPINATTAIFIQYGKYLWVSDGTEPNTYQLPVTVTVETNSPFGILGNNLYFSGVDENNDAELWNTDGTSAGTARIKNIALNSSSGIRAMILYNNELYFFANTQNQGYELWKTNGTEAGTILVKDINGGTESSYHGQINYTIFNEELYFNPQTTNGVELWKSNGSEGGTVEVMDINAGANPSNPTFLKIFQDQLFFTANDGINGIELWKTTGEGPGTQLVKDIHPGMANSGIAGILLFNNKMLLNAEAAPGDKELYISDGTTNGTILLKDINTGNEGSDPDIINGIIINNKVIFPATTAATGRELFISDGTGGGTTLFKEFNAGNTGSNPRIWLDRRYGISYNMAAPEGVNSRLQNGKIFFTVDYDPVNGQYTDLYTTDGTVENTQPVNDYFGHFQCCAFGYLKDNYMYSQNALYLQANLDLSDYEPFKIQNGQLTQLEDIWMGQNESTPVFRLFILNGRLFFTANNGYDDNIARDLYVIQINETALPMEIINFNAGEVNNQINITWSVLNQDKVFNFDIQRSTDGKHFNTIGTLKPLVNETGRINYAYLDKDARNMGNPVFYYRLQWKNETGLTVYSKVERVDMRQNTNQHLQLYTLNGRLKITYQSPNKEQVQIMLLNMQGQVIQSISKPALTGVNIYEMQIGALASGPYHVQVIKGSGKQQSASFIIQ